jgi:hypothetical protein
MEKQNPLFLTSGSETRRTGFRLASVGGRTICGWESVSNLQSCNSNPLRMAVPTKEHKNSHSLKRETRQLCKKLCKKLSNSVRSCRACPMGSDEKKHCSLEYAWPCRHCQENSLTRLVHTPADCRPHTPDWGNAPRDHWHIRRRSQDAAAVQGAAVQGGGPGGGQEGGASTGPIGPNENPS